MKNIISALVILVAMTACSGSLQDRAERAFGDVIEFASSENLKLIDKELIYAAPNDSLFVIEFTGKTQYEGASTLYFAYVVSKEGENDDYWVYFDTNPVAKAKRSLSTFDSTLGGQRAFDDEEMLYSTLKMNCSGRYLSGGGKSMEKTYEVIKKGKQK